MGRTVQDSVLSMMNTVSKKITNEGPIAWLQYFEETPGFFMSVDGQIAFVNNDSASYFIKNTLVKMIAGIKLQWSDIRIDPLTNTFASIGARFHEDINYNSGNLQAADGYFTAVAHLTDQGWKLHNIHWSIKH
jgi:hypothetical protein